MKTLFLPLKKEWYEMIERGEKTEEYREIKPYYIPRFLRIGSAAPDRDVFVIKLGNQIQ